MRSKYGNKKTTVDGILFDSKRESFRWTELKLYERTGAISNLRRQIPYEIIPAVTIHGKRYRAIKYVCDFVYEEGGRTVHEDSKGFATPEYLIKKRLMKVVHNIELLET